jgi:hypothetical protein
MPPADPLPLEPPSPGFDGSDPAPTGQEPEPVSQRELNSWRRGFTPQAEIWNGRLAMVGLSVGLTVLLIARLTAMSSP